MPPTTTTIPATAYAGGSKVTPSYGLRVSRADRDRHFHTSWQSVALTLPNGTQVQAPITPGFWNKCSEVRHADIGRWFVAQGLAPWPKGKPPRFDLAVLGPARFAVRVAS